MKKKILKILEYILAFLSRIYLKRTKPYIIGVTGSVGKTSCRTILSQVFHAYIGKEGQIYSSPKNFNSELGLVFSIFKIEKFEPGILNLLEILLEIFLTTFFGKKKYDILLLEYGIDHPGDMDFLLTIAIPDIAIYTKTDTVHSEFFTSPQLIWEEKKKLLSSAKYKRYLNYADEYCKRDYELFEGDTLYYSGKDISAEKYSISKGVNNVRVNFMWGKRYISTNVIGVENAQYISLALSLLEDYSRVYDQDLTSGFYDDTLYIPITLQGGRFSIFDGIANSILIDSSYNAAPASMNMMIKNIEELRLNSFPEYKILCVIGDMRELGYNSQKEHLQLGNQLQSVDMVCTIGSEGKKYIDSDISFFSARKAGIYLKKYIQENASDRYIILFKGSQNTIFCEEALKNLLLHPKDRSKLVRQDTFWLDKKEDFFEQIDKMDS